MTTNLSATNKPPPPVQSWENEGGSPPEPIQFGPKYRGLRGVFERARNAVAAMPPSVRRRLLAHDAEAREPSKMRMVSRVIVGAVSLGTAYFTLVRRRPSTRR